MAVHFDFVLSDIDAENLMDILNSEKVKLLERAMQAHCEGNANEQKFYKSSAAYVDGLKAKMKHSREPKNGKSKS